MQKSVFFIAKLDCPAEESLIRVKLDGVEHVKGLEFNLADRLVTVFHEGDVMQIQDALAELKMGSVRRSTREGTQDSPGNLSKERRILWIVLLINLSFFFLEMGTGLISGSMGLVADSLDMLADALVYGLSLMAIGGSLGAKKRVAVLAGIMQMTLATAGLAEVIRRFFQAEPLPDYQIMMVVSLLALIANVLSLQILQKSQSQEAHMRASRIFTSNDILTNMGIIAAGGLVLWTGTAIPDLIVGTVVFGIVMRGGFRIIMLAKNETT